MQAFGQELIRLGVEVYWPEVKDKSNPRKNVFEFLEEVKKADALFVYNQDSYCGNSATAEIGYATALGKPVYALCHDPDPNREVFYTDIVSDAQAFAKRL